MAFDWKTQKAKAIKKLKNRQAVLSKNGDMAGSNKVKIRLDRMIKQHGT